MSRLGLNAKMYRNTGTYGSPTWTEITNVVDENVPDEMEEADVTTRASGGFAEAEPTIRAVSLEFQMVNKPLNADLLALRAAYAARTAIDIVSMDGPILTVGSHGIRARYKVFRFTKGREIRGAQMIDVMLKPCGDENPVAEMTTAE